MWQLVMRNIWQRRLRSLLTVLGIAVAVQVNLTVTGVISGYEADLHNQLSTLAGRIFVQRPTTGGSEMEEFPSASSSISNDLARELLNLDGIDKEASSAILYLPLASPPISGLPPALSAVGIEAGHEAAFLSDLEISTGQGKLQNPRSVILGQGAAEQLSLKDGSPVRPGDTVELLNQRFSVAGVLDAAPGLFDGMVLMDLGSAQALFERPESVSAVILTMGSVEDVDSVRAKIEALDSRLQTGSQEEVMDAAMEMMSVTEGFTSMINSAVYVVVFLFVTIVMIVGVMERQHDIGVLRAIGASRRTIFRMIAGESLTLSLAGMLLAWPFWVLIGAVLVGEFTSPADVILAAWLQMGLLALCVGVGASLIPAWRAVRVDPLEALRYS
jgi:putative ABC transport system permease protein